MLWDEICASMRDRTRICALQRVRVASATFIIPGDTMYRSIFIASFAAAFFVAQATPALAESTTVSGTKSNSSSDRMGGGGGHRRSAKTTTPGTGTQTPAGATTVKGSKSN
jgi:hypothetical protein